MSSNMEQSIRLLFEAAGDGDSMSSDTDQYRGKSTTASQDDTTGRLSSLPPELLQMVAHRLPSLADIKSFRCIGKKFANAGAKYLIKTAYVFNTPSSISDFAELAKNPVFTPSLTRLFLESSHEWTYYTRKEHKDEWVHKKRNDLWTNKKTQLLRLHRHLSPERLREERKKIHVMVEGRLVRNEYPKAWNSYKRLVAYQAQRPSMWRYELDAFIKCNKLNTVVLTGDQDHGSNEYTCVDKARAKAFKAFNKAETKLDYVGRTDFYPDALNIFHVTMVDMLKAAAQKEVPLRDLTLVGLDLRHDPLDQHLLYTVFSKLESISTAISTPLGRRPAVGAGDSAQQETIWQGLCYATNLKSLKLGFHGLDDDASTPIQSSILSNYYPKLETLHLCYVDTTEEELLGFLMRHKDTLKNLLISHVGLGTGSWMSLFSDIAGKLPALQSVQLRDWLHDDAGDLEFVTRPGEEMRERYENMATILPYRSWINACMEPVAKTEATERFILVGGELPAALRYSEERDVVYPATEIAGYDYAGFVKYLGDADSFHDDLFGEDTKDREKRCAAISKAKSGQRV